MDEFASAGQVNVAESLDMMESMISRFINDDAGMERACLILAAVGLKVVPVSEPVVCESMYGAIIYGSAGIGQKAWAMNQQRKTPGYTTVIQGIPVALA